MVRNLLSLGFQSESGGKRSRVSMIQDPFAVDDYEVQTGTSRIGLTDDAQIENFYNFAASIARDANSEFVVLGDLLEGGHF